jgi:hypothetical protein
MVCFTHRPDPSAATRQVLIFIPLHPHMHQASNSRRTSRSKPSKYGAKENVSRPLKWLLLRWFRERMNDH